MIELINNNIKTTEIDLYELLISYIELHFHIFYFLYENNFKNYQIQSCLTFVRIIFIYILSLTNNIDLCEFLAFKFSMLFCETFKLSQIYEIDIVYSDIKDILLINFFDFFSNHKNLLSPNILKILDFTNYFLSILLFNFNEPLYNSKELSILIINIINFQTHTNLLFECLSKIHLLMTNPKFKPIWTYKLFNLKFTSLNNFLKKNYTLENSLLLLDKIWNETIDSID